MPASHPWLPIAYRETIRYPAGGERKYIRYFDGRGHFGHVRLELTPRPGERCSVSIDAACSLPEECCRAARRALWQRFDRGRIGRLPLIGFEVRLTGGSYLARHSYPEAYAMAACMAYDEALQRAGLFVVELYVGIRLLVEHHALDRTIKTLAKLLGEVQATHAVTDIVRLDVEIPIRLYQTVRSALGLHVLETFRLPKDRQYRALESHGRKPDSFRDELDEWT